MHIAIVSPHRDDAAFSCGLLMVALLRAGNDVTVHNLFTRSDYAITDVGIDPLRERVAAVSTARLHEDEVTVDTLLRYVGSPHGRLALHDYGWLDAPLRLRIDTESVVLAPIAAQDAAAQAHSLASQLHLRHADAVFVPLALGDHIDHRIARDAAREAVPSAKLAFYQDLPYAARLSALQLAEQTSAALQSEAGVSLQRAALTLPDGQRIKQALALCYPSQILPETALEMANYGAHLQHSAGAAAELWHAPLQLCSELRQALPGLVELVEPRP